MSTSKSGVPTRMNHFPASHMHGQLAPSFQPSRATTAKVSAAIRVPGKQKRRPYCMRSWAHQRTAPAGHACDSIYPTEQKRADMTTTQALRYERRRQEAERIERARQTLWQTITVILVCLLFATLMGIAEGGLSEPELEAREIAFWESQGISISRW